MIWIVTSAILYLIIAAAALVLICSESEPLARKESYYDIRNIAVALFWPLPLVWGGIAWAAHIIVRKSKATKNEDH